MEENLSEPGLELEIDTPMYEKYETMEMPVKNVDGYNYIGIIEIPSLGISLPVMECWDDAGAKKAPCRYVGSVYQDNMIIAGHNYKRHFSPLHSIDIDAEVIFTDIDGNQFRYLVDSLETVGGNDRDTMLAGDWDLTLFTCTFTRVDRLAVRCSRVEE